MKNRVIRNLFISCIFLLLVIPTLAQDDKVSSASNKPKSEIGDAVFRDGVLWWPGIGWTGHAAIYYCSKSQGADNYATDDANQNYPIIITDSDQKHSVIQASKEKVSLSKQTFNYFLDRQKYWGAYSNGSLTARQRRMITYIAKFQHGCKYELRNYPGIKKPTKGFRKGDGSFRCDGLVEYCYEWIVDGNSNGIFGERDDGFFKANEEKKCWLPSPQFYPKALMRRMLLSDGIPPVEVNITNPHNNDNVYGIVEITANASDGECGSGVNKVEFYRDRIDRDHLIGSDEHDSNINGEYRYRWDTIPIFSVNV